MNLSNNQAGEATAISIPIEVKTAVSPTPNPNLLAHHRRQGDHIATQVAYLKLDTKLYADGIIPINEILILYPTDEAVRASATHNRTHDETSNRNEAFKLSIW